MHGHQTPQYQKIQLLSHSTNSKYVEIISSFRLLVLAILVSHSVILTGYFIPVSHVVNKNSSQVPPTTSLFLLDFHQVCSYFTRNILSTFFFCSDQIICKRYWFFKVKQIFLSTRFCLVLVLLFRCFTTLFYTSTIMKLHFHGFQLGLSSIYEIQRKNSLFEDYKLLLFFRFSRKQSSKWILPYI